MSSWAMARDVSVTMSVQPFRAPMPEITAMAAMKRPAQALCGKMDWNALTNGDPGVDQGVVRHQTHDHRRHQHVQHGARRGADD